jgi:hypothetical protein
VDNKEEEVKEDESNKSRSSRIETRGQEAEAAGYGRGAQKGEAATTLDSFESHNPLIHPSPALRASVAERLTHGTMLSLNHLDFRRLRKSPPFVTPLLPSLPAKFPACHFQHPSHCFPSELKSMHLNLSRGQTVPERIQQAIRVPNTAVANLEKVLQGPDVPSRIVDAAAKGEPGTLAIAATILRKGAVKPEEVDILSLDSADFPTGPFFEDNVNSGIYPYNAYQQPFSHLKRPSDLDPQLFATRLQRLIIPTIMPAGLDAHQIINEREKFIDARSQQGRIGSHARHNRRRNLRP